VVFVVLVDSLSRFLRRFKKPQLGSTNNANVFRTGTLRALSGIELNLLTLTEVVVGDALDARVVEEHVVSGAGINETETLVSKPLNRAFSHH
jgi:hypothetical protein